MWTGGVIEYWLSRSSNPVNSDFWDIIHDGRIDAISGSVPGDVTLTVGIDYLCSHLATSADTLLASLLGCTLLAYTPYGEAPITDFLQIPAQYVVVLSAVVQPGRVSVCCVRGTLDVAYSSIEVKTLEGTMVSQEQLETAAIRSVEESRESNGGGQAAG